MNEREIIGETYLDQSVGFKGSIDWWIPQRAKKDEAVDLSTMVRSLRSPLQKSAGEFSFMERALRRSMHAFQWVRSTR